MAAGACLRAKPANDVQRREIGARKRQASLNVCTEYRIWNSADRGECSHNIAEVVVLFVTLERIDTLARYQKSD